jgi:hypothetical protein
MRSPRVARRPRRVEWVPSPCSRKIAGAAGGPLLATRRTVLAAAMAVGAARTVAAQTDTIPPVPLTPARAQAPSTRAGVHPVVLRAIAPSASTPYSLYVSRDSGRIVTHVEVTPVGWRTIRPLPAEGMPTDSANPHNVAGSPGGRITWSRTPICLVSVVSPASSDSLHDIACNDSTGARLSDSAARRLRHRLSLGAGGHDIARTPDGRLLIVVNRNGHSVRIFDAQSYQELAFVPTTMKTVHGIGFAPDGKYVFVLSESVATGPGALDAISLKTFARVASMAVP